MADRLYRFTFPRMTKRDVGGAKIADNLVFNPWEFKCYEPAQKLAKIT